MENHELHFNHIFNSTSLFLKPNTLGVFDVFDSSSSQVMGESNMIQKCICSICNFFAANKRLEKWLQMIAVDQFSEVASFHGPMKEIDTIS